MNKTIPKVKLWINGELLNSETGATFDVYNPFDNSLYAKAAEASIRDVDNAVLSAHAAFDKYKHCLAKERESWLLKAADLLEQRTEKFIDVLIDEVGSTLKKANNEVMQSVLLLRAAAGAARNVCGKTMPSDSINRMSMSIREPVGVIGAITPFNVPLAKGIRLTANPLALGNTVVLLTSEESPMMGQLIAKLYHDAGIPKGAFNMISGFGVDIGDSLTNHPLVKVVTFTGSCAVGKHIQEICGKQGKKVTLELGGKSPLVILSDAELDKAVTGAIQSIFAHQGQICMAASRIYVERSIFDIFISNFLAATKLIKCAELRDPESVIGPIINQKQRSRIKHHIEDATSKGAKLIAGGTWQGNCCLPTILTGVTSDMEIYAEETFGPVTSIYPIDSIEQAIEKSNDSVYGLSAAIYTTNLNHAMQYAKQIKSGMVHINSPTSYAEPHVPFGGIGDSGFGREGTDVDIDLMTEWKWVTIQL